MQSPADMNLVWMDLEMSGLDPKTCVVLEIATIITDKDLNLLAQGPSLVVHQPDSILDNMDDWNKKHHKESGLTQAVKDSKTTLADAERQTLDFISGFCKE